MILGREQSYLGRGLAGKIANFETRGSSMKITVKTVGWLSHHLPGDPAYNQAEVEVADDLPH